MSNNSNEESSKKPNVLSQFLAIGTGTIVNMFLGLISTPIITRVVDPNEYGQLSIFGMYTTIALMVLCLGLDQSLVRFFYDKGENTNYQRGLLKLCFSIPLLISVACAIAVSIIAHLKPSLFEFSPLFMALLGVNVIVNLWNRFSLLVLRVSSKSKQFAISNVLRSSVYIVVALGLIYTVKDNYLLLLVIATIISMLVPSVFATFSSKRLWNFRNSEIISNKKEVIRFGLPFIISMGLTSIFQACDKMALNHYCSYSEVGIYSSAMTLVSIFAIIQTSFNALWAPIQIEHVVKYPEDKQFYENANSYITIIMFFFGLCLILFKDIFALILGAKYREAATILPFLIFNPIMYTISETTNIGIDYSKKSYLHIIVGLGACVLNIIGNSLLVPILASRGAAISTGISYIAFFALRTLFSNRNYPANYHLIKFSVLTISTIGYAAVNTFFNNTPINIAAFAICLMVLVALYHKQIKELIRLGRRQLSGMLRRS